jgi:hypothetical protein
VECTETEGPTGDELTWRWHDNVIYGLSFDRGEPDNGDWRSDLILDIDFIVEWLCGTPGEFQFRVAPARLAFHDVTDFAISIDQGDSGGRNAVFEWSIDRVARQRLDRPFNYWRWTIHLHGPPSGHLAFCASGFTQTETAEPRLVGEQRLSRSQRNSATRN